MCNLPYNPQRFRVACVTLTLAQKLQRRRTAAGGLPKTWRYSFPRALKLLSGGASARGQRSKGGLK